MSTETASQTIDISTPDRSELEKDFGVSGDQLNFVLLSDSNGRNNSVIGHTFYTANRARNHDD